LHCCPDPTVAWAFYTNRCKATFRGYRTKAKLIYRLAAGGGRGGFKQLREK
jgi:hypothetical protein